MIGYKVALHPEAHDDHSKWGFHLVELEIPDDARVIESEWEYGGLYATFVDPEHNKNTEQKCRCDKAKVLKIHGGVESVFSFHDKTFQYKVGDWLAPRGPFDLSDYACGSGIHFFKDRDAAIKYGKITRGGGEIEVETVVDKEEEAVYTPAPLTETDKLESST
jgi:hypothetical protein